MLSARNPQNVNALALILTSIFSVQLSEELRISHAETKAAREELATQQALNSESKMRLAALAVLEEEIRRVNDEKLSLSEKLRGDALRG